MPKRRFVLIAVGSRGDAEPFCALAAELQKQENVVVDLFLQQDLIHLMVPSTTTTTTDTISVHTLPFSQADFYKFANRKTELPGSDHANPRVQFVGVVAEIIGELVLPCCDHVRKVVVRDYGDDDSPPPTMILATSLARQLALGVGEACNIPVGLVQLQPLQPVSAFPHYSVGSDAVQAILKLQIQQQQQQGDITIVENDTEADTNLETYFEPERFQHLFLRDRVRSMYIKVLQLEEDTDPGFVEMQAILTGQRDNIFVVNAFSNQLIPAATTASTATSNNNTWHVGPLADNYIADGWVPPTDLVDFVTLHRPICVGYGSMPFSKVTAVLQALREFDRKAVLVGSCFVDFTTANLDDDDADSEQFLKWQKNNVYASASVPYPWLLPQCSMMLSHGGAGVVNAVLRAGIPHVISPLIGDQFFWSQLLSAMNLGVVVPGTLTSVTKQDIVMGIRQAEDSRVQKTSSSLGAQIRDEADTGAERLVQRLLQL